ncbi:hypothetical protein CsSME_00025587 [Camellia sinensis var. sinensis]
MLFPVNSGSTRLILKCSFGKSVYASCKNSLDYKKLAARLNEDGVSPEFGSVALEHPSPVSILDDTMCRDDALSLVKQMPDVLKGSALL